jgi:outer membrane protein insertion porin family
MPFYPTPNYIIQVLGGVDPTGNSAAGLSPGLLGCRSIFTAGSGGIVAGPEIVSSVGYSLDYNTLDNNKNSQQRRRQRPSNA